MDRELEPAGTDLFRALNGVGIRQAVAAGGPATTLVESGDKERFTQGPRFLADGSRFLVLTSRPDGENVLELRAIDSTERSILVGRNPTIGSVATTPDGSYLVYARDATLFAQPYMNLARRSSASRRLSSRISAVWLRT